MDIVFFLLALTSLLAIPVGLIRPTWVLRWGAKRTRGRMLLWYGGFFLCCLVLFGVFMKPPKKADTVPTAPATSATAVLSEEEKTKREAEATAKREAEAKERELAAEAKKQEVKNQARSFLLNLVSIDDKSSTAFKAATSVAANRSGNPVAAYTALKAGSKSLQASMEEFSLVKAPDSLSRDVNAALGKMRQAFRSLTFARLQVVEAGMKALDSNKTSDWAAIREEMEKVNMTIFAVLLTIDESLKMAGFTQDEASAEIEALGKRDGEGGKGKKK